MGQEHRMPGATATTVMVVDDDPLFSLALEEMLTCAGYRVATAGGGHEALRLVRQHRPALILLDLGLPDIGGLDLCHLLRLQAGNVPIVMLTARRGAASLVAGLDAGADDFVTKPCDPEVLLARIRAVLRRAASGAVHPGELLEVGEVLLNAARHEVRVRGQRVDLSPKEFTLLWLLASNAGRVVPRLLIIDSVWGADFYGDVKALDVYIRLLRRKIEADPDHPRLITTVRGVGYTFTAPEAARPHPARPAAPGEAVPAHAPAASA